MFESQETHNQKHGDSWVSFHGALKSSKWHEIKKTGPQGSSHKHPRHKLYKRTPITQIRQDKKTESFLKVGIIYSYT